MEKDLRRCNNCAWLLLKDEGYSNYTVEETNAYCLLNLHPLMPGTTSYKDEDDAYDQAEKCDSFLPGEPLRVDVEIEEGNYELPLWENLVQYTDCGMVKTYLLVSCWNKL
jgi:hypothetical protein